MLFQMKIFYILIKNNLAAGTLRSLSVAAGYIFHAPFNLGAGSGDSRIIICYMIWYSEYTGTVVIVRGVKARMLQ